jgi:F420-dependent oxidoreductase-like protein
MQLGVHIASFPDHGRRLADTARAAEAGGAAQITLMDHWFQMEILGGPREPMLEGYTGLGFLAGITSRVRLGVLVTGVTYRHPGLLAKIITTLDVVSGGRAVLGLGAAWYEREHRGLGVAFPALAERFERLEETLEIVQQMWGPDEGPYEGRHYQLSETICVPSPVQQPIPIMIGGSGERKTLRLVAQYAQACNLFGADLDLLEHKLQVLDQHCADVGRDPAEVLRTVSGPPHDPVEDPAAYIATAQRLSQLGVGMLFFTPPATSDQAEWTERALANVGPALAEL